MDMVMVFTLNAIGTPRSGALQPMVMIFKSRLKNDTIDSMLNRFRDFGRLLMMNYFLFKYKVQKTETNTHIRIQKGNRTVTLDKSGIILEDYVKTIAAASWLGSDAIKEKTLADGWGCFEYPYRGDVIRLAYPIVNKSVAFFDIFFLQNEFENYLKQYKPKDGDVVIDAGAFHGIFAIVVSRMVGDKGRIICLEPDEMNLEILRKNLVLNGCRNISVSPKAFWSESTKLEFNSMGNVSSAVCGPSAVPDAAKTKTKANRYVVQSSSLKSIIEEFGLDKVDFVKMDVEGADIDVLDGAADIIRSQPINFAIASYHVRDGKPTFFKVEEILRRLGYRVRTGFPHMTTYAWKNRQIHQT
jgi:FkbM family methyltransferase